MEPGHQEDTESRWRMSQRQSSSRPGRAEMLTGTDDRPLAVLALCPEHDRAAGTLLVALGQFLAAREDRYRLAVSLRWQESLVQSVGIAHTVPAHPSLGGWRSVLVSARVVLRALLEAPVDVVHCASIHATYVATVAAYLGALRHPAAAEPAIVTVLPEKRSERQYALAAHHLRYLSDAVVAPSSAGRDLLMRHGLPGERAYALTGTSWDERFLALRQVYIEAADRCGRRGDPALAYTF